MTTTVLILINDAPYGTEKAYNALRLAIQLGKDHPAISVRLFLMGDAVTCAIPQQHTPNGYYNIEKMMHLSMSQGATIKICGSCGEARGLKNIPLQEGIRWSTMVELTQWVVDSDKVVTF